MLTTETEPSITVFEFLCHERPFILGFGSECNPAAHVLDYAMDQRVIEYHVAVGSNPAHGKIDFSPRCKCRILRRALQYTNDVRRFWRELSRIRICQVAIESINDRSQVVDFQCCPPDVEGKAGHTFAVKTHHTGNSVMEFLKIINSHAAFPSAQYFSARCLSFLYP